mgnify:CR=1
MLEGILGNINKERVLVYLVARGDGYPREIAAFFDTSLTPIQKQAEKLEAAGVLYSHFSVALASSHSTPDVFISTN